MPAKRAPTFEELVDGMSAIHNKLRRRKLTVAAAESCTGGLLAAVLTAHGGSSEFFQGGAVVYSNEAKAILADAAPDRGSARRSASASPASLGPVARRRARKSDSRMWLWTATNTRS